MISFIKTEKSGNSIFNLLINLRAEAATFVRIMGTLADWIDSDEFEQESRTMFAELTQKLGRP